MDGINIPPPQVIASFSQFEQRQPMPQSLLQNLVQQVQQQLASLPSNTTIYTTVLASDKGNLVVKLAGSELVLSSPIALEKGAQLALRVDNASGSATLQLVSVDGKLPATQPQNVSNQLPNPGQQIPNLKIIGVLPDGKQSQVAQTEELVRADPVIVTSQSGQAVKGVVISTSPEVMQTIRSVILANLPEEKASSLTASMPDKLKAGTEINFKTVNIQTNPPTNEQEFVSDIKFTADGKMRVNATVIGANNNDEILVQTPLGKIVLDSPAPNTKLSAGAVIGLEFDGIILVPKDSEKKAGDLQQLARNWDGLLRLASHSANPDVALNKLAGLDSLFASRIIGFINAVRNNKLEDWLGKELLESVDKDAKEELLIKLKADFGNIKQMLNEPNPNNWQTLLFPVYDGEQLHQARLFAKYIKDENGKPNKNAGTRFLVELETGYFGEVQFDGLVRNFEPSKNFDLMVRTKKPLEDDVRQDIQSIFNSSAEITGIKGSLEFAVMKDFPIHALDQKLSAQRHENIEV